MDFTQIDKIIGLLEKRTSARPGSPPVVINGNLGIWRTIRHNRMFLELLDGGKKQGKVLIGPPSFVGQSLSDISSDTWANLTPKATLKEFSNVTVADNGIQTLKQSIKDSVGPEDTRRTAVDDLDTKLQLVPIARSAGFTDDEIKMALAGKSPTKPMSSGNKDKADLPKTTVTSVQGNPTGDKPKEEPKAPTTTDDIPKATVTSIQGEKVTDNKPSENSDTDYIQDALARVLQPSKVSDSEENAAKVGALLVKLSKTNISDKLLAKEVEKVGHGLRSGDYSLNDAKEKLKSIVEDRERAKRNITVTDKELDALSDRAELKEFVDTFEERLDAAINKAVQELGEKFKPKTETKPEAKPEKKPEAKPETKPETETAPEIVPPKPEATPVAEPVPDSASVQQALSQVTESQRQSVQEEAILNLLAILEKNLKSAESLEQVQKLQRTVKAGNYNRRSIMFQLYQLLQILALLIPGL